MEQIDFIKQFKWVLLYMLDIVKAKNKDYAGWENPFKNFELVEKLDITTTEKGILTRITDKLSRINNLLEKEWEVKDEKITDTIVDLANYSIILLLYLKNKWK